MLGDRVALVGPGAPGPVGDVAGVLEVRLDGVPTGGEVRRAGLAGPGAGALPGMPNAFSQLSWATYAAVPSVPSEAMTAAMAATSFCRSFSLLSHPLSWLWSCSSGGLVSRRLSDIAVTTIRGQLVTEHNQAYLTCLAKPVGGAGYLVTRGRLREGRHGLGRSARCKLQEK